MPLLQAGMDQDKCANAGKATALGAATSTGNEQKGSRKEQDAGNEHAEASSDKSVQPEQAKVSSARDTEEDADWQPGKSSQQANVPETGSKKRKPPPRQTSKQAPRKATRAKRTKQTPAHDSTSQDSGDSSMHQGVIDLDAVHSKAQHKRQVLEDEDIVMTTEDASPQNGDGDGAVSSIKHVAAATSDEAPREDRQSRAAGSALDRITALDSILSHVAQAPQNADANPPITDDVKPKANMSLLDAMMADDDFEYAAQCSTEQHEQSNSAPATEDLATTVPHTQQDPQLDANKGDGTEHGIAGQLAPLAKKHATSVDVKTVASPTSLKGSLRARMKALGMASK